MKIAVYSGSFNPLHIGHKAIMECLTLSRGFDWVYLVISPQNPLKDPELAKSGVARYEAAIQAVKRHPDLHVWVDDIELKMPPPHYTIRTLDALRKREPDNEFVLVIGADNLDLMCKWKDYRRLLKEYGVVTYPRRGYDAVALRDRLLEEDPEYRIDLIDSEMVDISSTEIRDALASGDDKSAYLM